jgi:hypothetical protein
MYSGLADNLYLGYILIHVSSQHMAYQARGAVIAESLSMKPEDFSAAKSVRWISAFMEATVFPDMKGEAWWGK